MLLSFQGYFEAGRFITDTSVHIPDRRKTIVTVLDEQVDTNDKPENYRAYWNKIIANIQTSTETLEGEPERLRFKTPEEIDAL